MATAYDPQTEADHKFDQLRALHREAERVTLQALSGIDGDPDFKLSPKKSCIECDVELKFSFDLDYDGSFERGFVEAVRGMCENLGYRIERRVR